MSHILIGGMNRIDPELRSLLVQWGMTVDSWSATPGSSSLPTLQECDTFIWVDHDPPDPGACQGVMPDGTGEAVVPAAPLLFLGPGPEESRLDRSEGWIRVARSGPDGAHLWAALQACLARAEALRQAWGATADPDQHHHFLGHELRSPLTAIRTVLEALEGDLVQPVAPDADPGGDHLRLVRIALRNVQRLHRTVDWSSSVQVRRIPD